MARTGGLSAGTLASQTSWAFTKSSTLTFVVLAVFGPAVRSAASRSGSSEPGVPAVLVKGLVSRHVRRFDASASSARPLQPALAPSGVRERFLPRGAPATEQSQVGAVADSQPDDLSAAALCHVANREVFVFRHDAPAASNRKPPNLSVIGIPQPNVATRYRFFADHRQKPCQRWRQLRSDEEPHFIRLSDEDRMVEILGGVLQACADVLPLARR